VKDHLTSITLTHDTSKSTWERATGISTTENLAAAHRRLLE
jgi:hypothetical protein